MSKIEQAAGTGKTPKDVPVKTGFWQSGLWRLRILAILLFIPIVPLAIRTSWLDPNAGKVVIPPDYPIVEPEDHAKPTNDHETKMEASDSGGAVALSYSDKVSYTLAEDTVTLQFANPSSSTQSIILQVVIYGKADEATGVREEYLLAESGVLNPGYQVSMLDGDLDSNVSISQGVYSGVIRLLFYNPETGEKAIVNTEIPVDVTVK